MPLILEFGDIVGLVTGLDHRLDIFGRVNFPGIDNHGPLLGFEGLGTLPDDDLRVRFTALSGGKSV